MQALAERIEEVRHEFDKLERQNEILLNSRPKLKPLSECPEIFAQMTEEHFNPDEVCPDSRVYLHHNTIIAVRCG